MPLDYMYECSCPFECRSVPVKVTIDACAGGSPNFQRLTASLAWLVQVSLCYGLGKTQHHDVHVNTVHISSVMKPAGGNSADW
jgi:hypothetical protein